MASGYEKSPDYGGPDPGRPTFLITAILTGLAIACLLHYLRGKWQVF